MKTQVFAVYDSAVAAYQRPVFALSEGQAVRMFLDATLRQDTEFAAHPEDFALFKIGEFDDSIGEIIGFPPKCVAKAHELVANAKQKKQENGKVGDNENA